MGPDLESWEPAPLDRGVLERAWSIEARYSRLMVGRPHPRRRTDVPV